MDRIRRILLDRRLPLFVGLLGFALGLPFLGLGFQVDDYLHRAVFLQPQALDGLFGDPFSSMFNFADGDAERTNAFIARGMYPWFTSPEIKLRFWRPLTVATHWIDYRLWPDVPWLMHLQSLLWFGAAVSVVSILYRRLLGVTIVSGIASLLFALDDAHALPAGWIANRNSSVALVFGVSALIFHDIWRREGKTRAAPLAAAFLATALLAKEGAIAVCGYLFAYALFLDKGTWLRRIGSLAPYGAVVVAWRMYYQWAGYGASGSAGYVDPLVAPLEFLEVFSSRAPVYLASQFGFPPSDFFSFSSPAAQPYFVAWGVVAIVGLLPFFIPLLRGNAAAKFWALGMVLAVFPISSTGTMDRLLDFTGIGAMGLMAQFFVSVREGELEVPTRLLKRLLRPLYRVMFVIHFILAPVLFVGMMLLFAFASRFVVQGIDEFVTKDESLSEKTLVLVNTSNYPIGVYLHVFRALNGEPAPAAVRSLAPASIAQVPLEIERISETALRVTPEGGYPAALFRQSPDYSIGDLIELGDVTIEVLEVRDDGWPASVAYRFKVSLEDPSIQWLQIVRVKPYAWTPPSIGEIVVLDDFMKVEESAP